MIPLSHGEGGRNPAKAPEAASAAPSAPYNEDREATNQAALIAMLRRSEGATIAEIVEGDRLAAAHREEDTAGALKKRLGLDVTSENSRDEAASTPSPEPRVVGRRAWVRRRGTAIRSG